MLRRLASRRATQALSAVAILTWGAASAQASTFNYTGGGTINTPISGNFSTGFLLNGTGAVMSPATATLSDSIIFGGTSTATIYTATDDLPTQIMAGGLQFTNQGAVTIARSTAAGASNSIGLGPNNAFTTSNAGAVTFSLDMGLTANAITNFTINSDVVTLNGILSGTNAGLTKLGSSGTLILNASNIYSGPTNIQQGTLQVGSGGTTGTLGTDMGSITNYGTLSFNRSDAVTFANVLAGAGMLQQMGNGTLSVTGANTFTGGTTIEAGTLLVDNSAGGSLAATGTVFDGGGVFQYNGSTSVTSVQTLGSLSFLPGQSSVVLSGGTGTTLNLGTLSRSSGGTVNFTLPAGDILTTMSAGTGMNAILGYATVNGTTFATIGTGTGPFSLTGLPTSSYSDTVTTPLASAAGLDADVLAAGSNATVAGTPVTLDALRFNDGTGASTVDASGGLTLSSNGILETSAVGANAVSIINGTLTGNSANGPDLVITQNNTSAPMTISAQITGASDLTKAGAGLLILSGANSYTGQTTIAQGTLQMGAANVLPVTNLLLGGSGTNATLDLNGFNQAVGALNTTSINGGTVNPSGFITNNGAALSTLTVNGAGTFGGTIKDGTGQTALTVAGGNQTLTGVNTYTGATNITGGTLTAGANNALSPNSAIVLANSNTSLNIGRFNVQVGSLAGGSTLYSSVVIGTGLLSIGSDNTNTSYNGAFSVTGSSSATGGVSKVGTGTLTLTGSSFYTTIRHLYVNNGTVNLDSTITVTASSSIGQNTGDTAAMTLSIGSNFYSTADLNVGDATGASGSLNDTSPVSTTLRAAHLYVGKSGTATGIVYHSDSNVETLATGDAIIIGGGSASDTASVGIYNISGGTLQTDAASANLQVGQYGTGQLSETGGTVAVTGTAEAGHQAGSFGVIDVTGGNFNQTGTGAYMLIAGDNGTGIISVRGGNNTGYYATTLTATGGIVIGSGTAGTGIFNLDNTNTFNFGIGQLPGSILAATTITTAGGTGTFNFNGGTLKSLTNGGTLLGGVTNAYVNGTQSNAGHQVISYGGGTIDTTGGSTTISQNLLAPTGNGVGYVTTTNGGTGFKVAPIVKITGGGGTGATAVATVNINTGAVTGITITNPGVNYTSVPAITLITANGGTGAAFTPTLAANTVGSLAKTGPNTLTLTGNNTFGYYSTNPFIYTGFTAEQGTTIAATDTALGIGPLQFYCYLNTATVVAFTSLMPSVGSISSYLGKVNGVPLPPGTIILGNAGVTPNATTLSFGIGNTSGYYTGTISDGTATKTAAIGSLVKVGLGTQYLTGVNTYTGGTMINGGRLFVSSDSSLGSSAGTVTINAATLDVTGTGAAASRSFMLGSATSTIQADGTYTITGVISDGASAGTLNKTGNGTLALTASNTFTGGTYINGVTLSAYAAGPSTNGSLSTGPVAVSAGTLDLEGVTGGGTVGTVANTISGVGNLSQGTASGTNVSAGTIVTLTGNNTYTGGTAVSAGTLSGNVSSFGGGAMTTTSPGTIDYTQGGPGTVNNNITGTGQISINGNTSSPNGSGGQITYTGQDSASGGTTVTGVRFELSHANGGALSGPVTAAAGSTVGISSDNQIAPSSNVALLGNSTLLSEGHNEGSGTKGGLLAPTLGAGTLQIGNPTTAATATLDFGDTSLAGVVTPALNTLAFADSSGLTWNGTLNITNYTGAADQLYIGTSADLTPNELSAISFNGVNGAHQLGNGEVVMGAVTAPEPGGLEPLLLGTCVLGGIIARKRRKSPAEAA